MVPFRMRIQLQILASYFGPVKDMVEYRKEELPAELGVPIDEFTPSLFDITWEEVEKAAEEATGISGGASSSLVNYSGQLGQANDGNHQIRLQALEWAYSHVIQGGPGSKSQMNPGWTNYATAETPNYGVARHNLPTSADCSGLVTEAYKAIGHGKVMGWESNPGTASMPSSLNKNNAAYIPIGSMNWQKDLLPGDIFIRPGSPGHTAFFVRYREGGGGCVVFDAASSTLGPEVGERSITGTSKFTHVIRPTPLGALGSAAQASSYNSSVPRAV